MTLDAPPMKPSTTGARLAARHRKLVEKAVLGQIVRQRPRTDAHEAGGVALGGRHPECLANGLALDPFDVLAQPQRKERSSCTKRSSSPRWRRRLERLSTPLSTPRRARWCFRALVRFQASGMPGATQPRRLPAPRSTCRCAPRACATKYLASMETPSRSRSGGTTIGDHVQAIGQIVLEPTLVYELTEVAVGRRNHTDIHLLGPIPNQAARLPVPAGHATAWPEGCQPSCQSHRGNGAVVGKGKLAFLGGGGVRKRPSHMPEELRFQKGVGNRSAVHLDKRHAALRAAMVHGTGHQLLARAGFAGDQYGAASGPPLTRCAESHRRSARLSPTMPYR